MTNKKIKQIDYIQTYFGEHSEEWSHDQINRYLREKQLKPHQVWENVRDDLFVGE